MNLDQASGLREPAHPSARARFVAVLSGKGGVGKTNLATNVAVAAAGLQARVLLVDGDLGLANIDVLLGLIPPNSVADLLDRRCSLAEVLMDGPRGIRILPAAGGRTDLAAISACQLHRLSEELRAASHDYDLVLIDAGSGVGPSVIGLAGICDRALIVTTSEPTSLADAYAALKVLSRHDAAIGVDLIVNSVRDEVQARLAHARLDRMAQRFLNRRIGFRGFLPHDPRLVDAVGRQQAVVELFPAAASSRQFVALAQSLLREEIAQPNSRDLIQGEPACIPN